MIEATDVTLKPIFCEPNTNLEGGLEHPLVESSFNYS